jgi:hypothetical protein
MKRVYLSGPMTGIEAWNFPAFHAAAAALRAEGYEVISPAELDEAEDAPLGSRPWEDYLRRDLVEMLAGGCKAIALLPGHEASRGARLELHVASALGFEVIYLKPPAPSLIAQEARQEVE